MSSRWTDADSDRLKQLHSEGKSLHAIAKEMNWSKETVSRHAKRLGIVWDRARTAKATEAVIVDNKTRRARIEERLLGQVERELDRMEEPGRVFSFGGADNVYREEWLERPPAQDRNAMMRTISAALTSANRLAELNSAGKDLPAVDAWIEAMTGMGNN